MRVNTGTGLMIFRYSLALLLIIIASAKVFAGSDADCKYRNINVSGDEIVLGNGENRSTIKFAGELMSYTCSGYRFYYLTGKKINDDVQNDSGIMSVSLGYISRDESYNRLETGLELVIKPGSDLKMLTDKSLVYIYNGGGIFYRINLDSMDISRMEGVSDAALAGSIPIAVEDNGKVMNINGKKLPLSIQGNVSIAMVIADRFVHVTNGEETEIIDSSAVESIYQYSEKGLYAVPGEYNLLISAEEEAEKGSIAGEAGMVFYKVYVDGIESGRTETGVTGTEKHMKVLLETGSHHLIKLERWELSRKKNRYTRANNLYQPESVRIYMPQKRVLKLEVKYNGKEYSFSKRAVKR